MRGEPGLFWYASGCQRESPEGGREETPRPKPGGFWNQSVLDSNVPILIGLILNASMHKTTRTGTVVRTVRNHGAKQLLDIGESPHGASHLDGKRVGAVAPTPSSVTTA